MHVNIFVKACFGFHTGWGLSYTSYIAFIVKCKKKKPFALSDSMHLICDLEISKQLQHIAAELKIQSGLENWVLATLEQI